MEIHFQAQGLKIESAVVILGQFSEMQGEGSVPVMRTHLELKMGSETLRIELPLPREASGKQVLPQLKEFVSKLGGQLDERPIGLNL